MSNNNNKFEIEKYIKDNLEKEELKNKVIINLTEDDNHEPYIEITYITEEGVEAGFVKNYDKLYDVKEFAVLHNYLLEEYISDAIIPIIYDPQTQNLNLLKRKNNSYKGYKFKSDQPNAFFVGYICNKDVSMSFEDKISYLTTIIATIMHKLTEEMVSTFIFKVKNEELQNRKYKKSWNYGYKEIEENTTRERIDDLNDSMIKTKFKLDLPKK